MRHLLLLFCLTPVLLTSVGCNRSRSDAPGLVPEPYVSDSGSVGFDLEPLVKDDGAIELRGVYTSQGKTARFSIDIEPAKLVETNDSTEFPNMKVGKGKFVAEPGSDASVLLVELRQALEAKAIPSKPKRVRTLPFTFVDIGDNLSQASNGGFNATPRGHWTAMKIFLGEGDKESEVFVNYNLVSKKGQFSIKDSGYGDLVLAELGKVL
jgi:hypothetical protein